MFKSLKISDGIPILILDTISYCNLKCPMCPQSNDEELKKAKRGKMDFSLYRKIIDDICSYDGIKVNAIMPFWNGEALLHPEFSEMIEYASKRKAKYNNFNVFSLHTNFLLADKKMIETIIDSKIFGPITFSIDACTSTTYEKIRVGGDFEKVINNIEYFLYYRTKKGLKQPVIVSQFIIMDENFKEAKKFLKYFSNIFKKYSLDVNIAFDDTADFSKDGIYFRLLQTGNPEKQVHARKLYEDAKKELGYENINEHKSTFISDVKKEIYGSNRKPCIVLWQQLAIRYDGEASLCCRDIGSKMEIGNVREKHLKELFFGNKANTLRIWHIKGEFDKFSLCKHCLDQTEYKIMDEDIKIFTHFIKKPELFKIYKKRIYGSKNFKKSIKYNKKMEGEMNMGVKYYYDKFKKTKDYDDFLLLAEELNKRRKFKTFISLQKYYKVKYDKLYAYLAYAYQNIGNFKRARRLYYKLARKLDPKFYISLGYVLRCEKKYFLSGIAYIFGAFKLKEYSKLKDAFYSFLLILKLK